MNTKRFQPASKRFGASLVIVAIVLIVLFGFVALAVDIGYVALTKTSMQAAADSAALSGGTELKSSLGRTPVAAATMRSAATALAVDYASRHANGDVTATYLDSTNDVKFGWAKFNNGTGAWDLNWGSELPDVGGHNLIGVLVHRDRTSSTNNDKPLPLIFASVIGSDKSNLQTKASAVIMPAKGIRITPGSDEVSELMPFALYRGFWQKYLRAQAYYEGHPNMFDSALEPSVETIQDDTPLGNEPLSGEPLFGHFVTLANGTTEFRQDFADDYNCGCAFGDANSTVSDTGRDYVLEIDAYPRDNYTSGNFGSVDIGDYGNSTADLARQIETGISADDLAAFADNTFQIPDNGSLPLNGDTGVSAGIKDELESQIGRCRALLLFDTVVNPGNNATFYIVEMVGIRIMDVQLTGNLEYKHLSVQLCEATLTGAIGDLDDQIDEGTTVFTPLILVE